MNMNDVYNVRAEAFIIVENADTISRQTAELCAGRLRLAEVRPYVLDKLKRELRGYNMHTGTWSDK